MQLVFSKKEMHSIVLYHVENVLMHKVTGVHTRLNMISPTEADVEIIIDVEDDEQPID